MLSGWISRLARRRHTKKPATASHAVICNDAGDHLIWPSNQSLPADWRYLGKVGSAEELRAYLQETLAETRPTPLVVEVRDPDLRKR